MQIVTPCSPTRGQGHRRVARWLWSHRSRQGLPGVINLQVLASVATGNAVGSATAPIVLLTLP